MSATFDALVVTYGEAYAKYIVQAEEALGAVADRKQELFQESVVKRHRTQSVWTKVKNDPTVTDQQYLLLAADGINLGGKVSRSGDFVEITLFTD